MDKKKEIMSRYIKYDMGGCPVYNEQSVIGMLSELEKENNQLVKENKDLKDKILLLTGEPAPGL